MIQHLQRTPNDSVISTIIFHVSPPNMAKYATMSSSYYFNITRTVGKAN